MNIPKLYFGEVQAAKLLTNSSKFLWLSSFRSSFVDRMSLLKITHEIPWNLAAIRLLTSNVFDQCYRMLNYTSFAGNSTQAL